MPLCTNLWAICHYLVITSTKKWHALRGKELRGKQKVGSCAYRKPTHDFPIPLNSKVLLTSALFGRNFIVKLCPQIQHPHLLPSFKFWGYAGPRGTKMVPIEILAPHSYSTSIQITGLSCTVFAQCTPTSYRQMDRHYFCSNRRKQRFTIMEMCRNAECCK